jgi:oligosaccharide repeat unit polymerase
MTEFVFIKLASIILSFGFIFLAWISKRVVGHWLNPSSIFSLFWFLYTFLPLVLALPAPINPAIILYILTFNFCFVSSACLLNWKVAFAKNKNKPSPVVLFDTFVMHASFYLVSIISIISLVIGVATQGDMNIVDFFNNPLAFAGEYAGKGYGGELKPSIFAKIGLTTSYIVIVLGGLLYGAGKQKKVLLIAFLPSLLVRLLQSAKGLFFFSIFIFIAGILTIRLYNQTFYLLTLKELKKLLLYACFAMPIIIMSFLSRGLQNVTDMDIIIHRIVRFTISYSSGHLYAFSDWFSDRYFEYSVFSYRQEEFTAGFYSLMSVYRLLGGDRDVPLGVYLEYFEHDFHLKTNIYTVFRGIITDFTLVGSLILACFLGLLCNVFFYRLLCSKNNPFYIVFFIFFVGITYQTYIISTLMWSTIPVVFILLTLFLFVYFRIYNKIRF